MSDLQDPAGKAAFSRAATPRRPPVAVTSPPLLSRPSCYTQLLASESIRTQQRFITAKIVIRNRCAAAHVMQAPFARTWGRSPTPGRSLGVGPYGPREAPLRANARGERRLARARLRRRLECRLPPGLRQSGPGGASRRMGSSTTSRRPRSRAERWGDSRVRGLAGASERSAGPARSVRARPNALDRRLRSASRPSVQPPLRDPDQHCLVRRSTRTAQRPSKGADQPAAPAGAGPFGNDPGGRG